MLLRMFSGTKKQTDDAGPINYKMIIYMWSFKRKKTKTDPTKISSEAFSGECGL